MEKQKHLPFLIKGIFFFFFLVFIDLISGFLFDSLYSISKSGVAYQENQVFYKTKDSILIFGSSRAAFHYQPEIITEQTGLSCYNAGREGMGIYFHYAALLATLERYNPKIIVLDLDFRDVYYRGGSFGKDVFSDLAPFYGKINCEFDDYICRNFYDPILYRSNLIKYNKKFFNILTANVIKNNDNSKGYIPLKGEWNGKEKVLKGDVFKISPELIKSVNGFISKAKSHNIKVVLVISPTFKKINPEFFKIANEIAILHGVKLISYYGDKDFILNKSLFHDSEHLNNKGAILFSQKVASQIKL